MIDAYTPMPVYVPPAIPAAGTEHQTGGTGLLIVAITMLAFVAYLIWQASKDVK